MLVSSGRAGFGSDRAWRDAKTPKLSSKLPNRDRFAVLPLRPGAINAFDLDSWECARTKVRDQLGVPDTVSMFLGLHTKECPMLRLAPYDEIKEALRLMAPVAKGDFGGLDIDHSAADEIHIWAHLIIVGQLDFVLLWDELIYRGKTYKKLSDDEYADRYQSECDEIMRAFPADCQRRLEEVKRATAEGRYEDI